MAKPSDDEPKPEHLDEKTWQEIHAIRNRRGKLIIQKGETKFTPRPPSPVDVKK